jgi:hypothetical protein
MTKTILLTLLTTFLISCHTPASYETIAVRDYFIKVPSHMEKTTALNDLASLQYQNPYKELYIIVLDENKVAVREHLGSNSSKGNDSNSFDRYFTLLSTNLATAVKMKNRTKKDTIIHSLQSKILKFEGEVNGIKVFYETAFVNGKANYYQVTTWTLLDRRADHEAEMDKMIYSFKLRKKKAKKK